VPAVGGITSTVFTAEPYGAGGCNLLLDVEAFAAKMGQCGVDAETTVVVYDTGDENWAARIWWALKYYGHDQVYVLQGGAAACGESRGR
jgi:thiosulfate/3-mercaptopyruvate sulfurtransferase